MRIIIVLFLVVIIFNCLCKAFKLPYTSNGWTSRVLSSSTIVLNSEIHYHNYHDYGMHNSTRRALAEISKYTEHDELKRITDEYKQTPVDPSTHIFCNVELDLQPLQAIGFDMDFTLAQYNNDFDLLAFEGAKKKLVDKLGYPKEILQFKYQPEKFQRGLIIDAKKGNVLKIDRHRYVSRVYHGFREYSAKTRKEIYDEKVYTFTEDHYFNVDTFFMLVDIALYINLVAYRDSHMDVIQKSYDEMYRDIRAAVDACHFDGVIKDTVKKNPSKYIIYDENVVTMLKQLKQGGKKVFLLTNSLYDYTNAVMNYLVHGKNHHKKNTTNSSTDWKDLFDVIVVGACKPAFLKNEYLTMFQVDEKGHLYNIENKEMIHKDSIKKQKIFQGGNWQDLHRLLDIKNGKHILYVGDHMYADILRSKKTLGWRTCLIIPELNHELSVVQKTESLRQKISWMRDCQAALDSETDHLRVLQMRQQLTNQTAVQVLSKKERLKDEVKGGIKQAQAHYNRLFNPHWGPLFKCRLQDSRFAKQVKEYACLYTSRASNLGLISPYRSFRPMKDYMAHDISLLADPDTLPVDSIAIRASRTGFHNLLLRRKRSSTRKKKAIKTIIVTPTVATPTVAITTTTTKKKASRRKTTKKTASSESELSPEEQLALETRLFDEYQRSQQLLGQDQ